MDTSPTRLGGAHKSPTLSPLRRENTKTIPKFSGDPNMFKQKFDPQKRATSPTGAINGIGATTTPTAPATTSPTAISTTSPTSPSVSSTLVTISDSSANETKTGSGPLKSPTVQTKIPMKRVPTSNFTPKTAGTPRVPPTTKPQIKSPSKISLTIKEIGNKKLEPNSSKLSFKAATSTNLRPPMSLAKSMTARGALGSVGISRRSGSTVSCRSVRSQKAIDSAEGPNITTSPTTIKSSPGVGDHDSHNNLSARARVAENNKVKVFETLRKKLMDLQSEFMSKYEALKLNSPEKLKGEYKFITMIKNDECKLVVADDDQLKVPRKLPATSVSDLKEKIKMAFDNNLTAIINNLGCAGDIEDTKKQLELEQSQQLNEIHNFIHEVCTSSEVESDMQIVKMQKEIQEGRKALNAAERKLNDVKCSHQEEILNIEKSIREKLDQEIVERDTQIAELQKKNKALMKQIDKLKLNVQQTNEETLNEQTEKQRFQDELRACKESLQSTTKKLSHAEQQLAHERKEKHEKAEALHKLEGELEQSRKRSEELQTKGKNEQMHQIRDQLKEIHMLKEQVQDLDHAKKELEHQIEELRYDSETLKHIQKDYALAQEHISELQKTIQENSNRLLHDTSELPKEIQNELAKLRQSECEKRREIEKLKVELSKAHFNICQLEEQIQRDQQLLEVRSELINSLQTNDNSQRIHLEEMFAQAAEKNNTINEVGLNNELRTKSEEFRNLFTTLSTKQLELSRQEHMIKLLEESNERSQMLRVKQEEKIGRMEDEIAHLKQTLAVLFPRSGIYQNKVHNSGSNGLLFAPVTPNDEYNENFYYYTSERRRKRQLDINVKKYET